ncbi:MAG: hypothetical protein VKP70_07630 [Cyanobacteriota bacterium]|nr:hypothetical protein [Cyanobacteriota bacterium]
MGKCLVVILSETRAFDLTFQSFYDHLLKPLDADLALCVAENDAEQTLNPFYQHATYVWTYPEPKDWSTALDYAQDCDSIVGQDWRQLFGIHGNFLGGLNDHNGRVAGSGGISMFFRWYLKRCLLKEPGLLDHYHRYVVTRSDFMYLVPHYPLTNLDPAQLWLPLGEDYHGYTDRHIIADRETILPAISLLDPILNTPADLYEELRGRQDYLSFEGYIGYAFRRAGLTSILRRYPYTMYAVRHPDGRTSWSKGAYNEKLGYCIKYKPEYISSLLPTAMIKSAADWTPARTAAFFMVSNWIEAIDQFTRQNLTALANPFLRKNAIILAYGTVLSDRFFVHVYPNLAAYLARLLALLPASLSRKPLRRAGFLEPVPTLPSAVPLDASVAV